METLREILRKLPPCISQELELLPSSVIENLEEIRMRCGHNIRLNSIKGERIISHIVTRDDLQKTLNSLINFSYYAYEDDLAKGFVTIEGGHRVGVCGKVVVRGGEPALIKEISSLNIRFAKEVKGCSDQILKELIKNNHPQNTLIVSPPNCGKTTMLRDIAKNLSYKGFKVAVCDERSEIAGVYNSCPSFDLGPRTDVLDGCEKAYGIPMLIRTMSPHVIITDEIGKNSDIDVINQCLNSGVSLITSIHGSCYEDIKKSHIGVMIENKAFGVIVYLSCDKGPGTVKEVVNV